MTCLNNFLALCRDTCQVTKKSSHKTPWITHPSPNTKLLLKVCKRAGTVGNTQRLITKFTETRKCIMGIKQCPVTEITETRKRQSTAATDAVLNQHCNSKGREAFQYPKRTCATRNTTPRPALRHSPADSDAKKSVSYFFSSTTHPSC